MVCLCWLLKRRKPMKKFFEVYAIETEYHQVTVQADSAEEAAAIAYEYTRFGNDGYFVEECKPGEYNEDDIDGYNVISNDGDIVLKVPKTHTPEPAERFIF